ncbi:MAG: DUF423 domain-containing protein [Porticoccaceae bacterium]|nr:DUF423 domain-containing protein [Pseudomonadales bacterium]MCP5172849.1 DUF423 domain-containing protein [Pseudomonadales bacterium]MCP5302323.1 DUF423 domain-containing protein [Pseudomonadales bacterium]
MKLLAIFTGISGFLGVALGAFGAHALRGHVEPQLLSVWQTAVQYQMFHVLALLAVLIMMARQPRANKLYLVGSLFSAGIIVFSGSLYVLVLTGIKQLGMITPIGGVLLLLGWLVFVFALVAFTDAERTPS